MTKRKAIKDPNGLLNDSVDEVFVRSFEQMMIDYRATHDTKKINDKELIALVSTQILKEGRRRIAAIFAAEEERREAARKERSNTVQAQ